MSDSDHGLSLQKPRFKPIYFLAFSGDLLGSLLIVSCVLVGTKLGVDDKIIGILASSYGVSYMFSAAVFGRVSDRIGRRRSLIITAIGFSIIAGLFISFPSNVPLLVLGQVTVGILYGFWWSSIEAYISENTTAADHQRKVNNFCVSWSLGYTIGPFLGPLLSIIGAVYSFSLLLVFSLANIVVVGLFIRPSIHSQKPPVQVGSRDVVSPENQELRNLAISSVILVLAIFTYAFTKSFFIGMFQDIALSKIGFNEIQTSVIGLAFGLARTASFIAQNRMKSKSIILRVLLAIGLSASGFLFATTSEFVLYLAFISIMGVFSGLVYTTTLELLLQINEKRKGRIAGFFEASIGIGTFISPILGSSVLGFGYVAAFVVVASVSTAIATLALVFYLVLASRKK